LAFCAATSVQAKSPKKFYRQCEKALNKAADLSIPSTIEIELNRERSEQLFQLAVAEWKRALDQLETRAPNWLSTLGDGSAVDIEERQLFRRAAARLRSAFQIFDDKHEAPPVLDDFTIALGKLNDKEDNEVSAKAKLIERIKNGFDADALKREIRSFEPATRKSVARHFDEVSEEVANLLEERDLDVKEFHELRKLMKNYLTMSIQLSEQEPQRFKDAFEYFFELNDRLGKAHDSWVTFKATNKNKVTEGTRLEIPKPLKKALLRVIDSVEVVSAQNRIEVLARANHILQTDTGWSVLLPEKDGGWRVQDVGSWKEAVGLVEQVKNPLDFLAESTAASKSMPWLQSKLESIVARARAKGIEVETAARVKEPDSIQEKFFEKVRVKGERAEVRKITDTAGGRLIVGDWDESQAVERMARKELDGLIVESHVRSYDQGYRGVHLVAVDPTKRRIEFQILTKRMAAWTEMTHDKIYKPEKTPTDEVYFERLKTYYAQMGEYFQRLDDGLPATKPTGLGIRKEDRFP
jgi:ppGpp synthetase/RelA/SpoT-type nucleotidyltranferase